MLSKLLQERIDRERLSAREAGKAAGVAHTTIIRVLEGQNVDFPTVVKICNWLNVSPADALNVEGVGESAFAAKVAMLFDSEPALKSVLAGALENYEQGILTEQDLREIIEYAAFKIQWRKEARQEGKK